MLDLTAASSFSCSLYIVYAVHIFVLCLLWDKQKDWNEKGRPGYDMVVHEKS